MPNHNHNHNHNNDNSNFYYLHSAKFIKKYDPMRFTNTMKQINRIYIKS